MQQHTGQHVLSAAFDRLFGVRTVSFHLGAETSTIDLAREVTPPKSHAPRPTRIAWSGRANRCRSASSQRKRRAALPLRKEPARTGPLRLVEVGGLRPVGLRRDARARHRPDRHHRRGRLGAVQGRDAAAFVCGGRALRSHGALRDVVTGATRALSVAPGETCRPIERLQAEIKDRSGGTLRRLQEEVAVTRAAEFRAERGDHRAVSRRLKRHPRLGRRRAEDTGRGGRVASRGSSSCWPGTDSRSRGRERDRLMSSSTSGAWMKQAIAALGGRGGGRPELAQGGLAASAERVLAFAREKLHNNSECHKQVTGALAGRPRKIRLQSRTRVRVAVLLPVQVRAAGLPAGPVCTRCDAVDVARGRPGRARGGCTRSGPTGSSPRFESATARSCSRVRVALFARRALRAPAADAPPQGRRPAAELRRHPARRLAQHADRRPGRQAAQRIRDQPARPARRAAAHRARQALPGQASSGSRRRPSGCSRRRT